MNDRPHYHEKQEGSLCGLHATNNLLQRKEFFVNDFDSLSREFDLEERALLEATNEGTGNSDADGNYSIQVIMRALNGLHPRVELIWFDSPDPRAVEARAMTAFQDAFLLNRDGHWFAIRRFGRYWYNLDSRLDQPELLSFQGPHLNILSENRQRFYSGIFVVYGNLDEAARPSGWPEVRSSSSNRCTVM